MMRAVPDRKMDPRRGVQRPRPVPPPPSRLDVAPGRTPPDGGPLRPRRHVRTVDRSVPLPAAEAFDDIDPQCDCVITTEIASGRFEDDLRRMRMAAWHGADHIMVIRTTGQSHIDGLLEGTPEGVGGMPITRKQVRATRKALDAIEDEVGRPINFHSYVSGLAGPEIAVMFLEEGVNGAHQDPQYNVLYRNINMHRSFVDAAEAKTVMAAAGILQIDGAHNANATAKEAWKVMPELLVQHGDQLRVFSGGRHAGGADRPVDRAADGPAGAEAASRPAVRGGAARALRRLQVPRPAEHPLHRVRQPRGHGHPRAEPARLAAHVGRHPEHDHARRGPQHPLALQQRRRRATPRGRRWSGIDGLREMVKLDRDGPALTSTVREIKERAVLFLEEMVERRRLLRRASRTATSWTRDLPRDERRRHRARHRRRASAAGTIVAREPTTTWRRSVTTSATTICPTARGSRLRADRRLHAVRPDARSPYIDELDPEDNVESRLGGARAEQREKGLLEPEVRGVRRRRRRVSRCSCPPRRTVAEAAALEMARAMGLREPRGDPQHGSCIRPRARSSRCAGGSRRASTRPTARSPSEELLSRGRDRGVRHGPRA